MFERMTDRARRVIVLAQEEARGLNHSYIGTEHILLGMLNEGEGIGCQALVRHGMSLAAARIQIVEIIGEGTESPFGHIPFTPRAKKVLEFSLREALQLGHNYIGTEHILLGMVREGEGVAAHVLANNGLTIGQLRETVLDLLQANPEQRIAASRTWPGSARALCLHLPDALRYRPVEIPSQTDLPPMRATLVTCSLCNATVGVLPA
jgi:ATP-dependent Clp protease ATP-binding subunit ClpC